MSSDVQQLCPPGAANPPEQTLEMYGELLGCARRMLRIARTRRWHSLMSEEVEFVRVYEQIAANEAAHSYTGEQADLREVFLSEIFSRVRSTRGLLNERQRQLARESHDAGCGKPRSQWRKSRQHNTGALLV